MKIVVLRKYKATVIHIKEDACSTWQNIKLTLPGTAQVYTTFAESATLPSLFYQGIQMKPCFCFNCHHLVANQSIKYTHPADTSKVEI